MHGMIHAPFKNVFVILSYHVDVKNNHVSKKTRLKLESKNGIYIYIFLIYLTTLQCC